MSENGHKKCKNIDVLILIFGIYMYTSIDRDVYMYNIYIYMYYIERKQWRVDLFMCDFQLCY